MINVLMLTTLTIQIPLEPVPTGQLFPVKKIRSTTVGYHLCNSGGFSILEILTVIAILIPLMALSVPNMIQVASSRGLGSALDQISAIMDMSRTEAMAKGTYVFVGLSQETKTGEEGLVVGQFLSRDGSLPSGPVLSDDQVVTGVKAFRIGKVRLGTAAADANGTVLGSSGATGSFTVNTVLRGENVTFANTVLTFTPRGEVFASQVAETSADWIDIPLLGMNDTKNRSAVRVSRTTGYSEIKRDY